MDRLPLASRALLFPGPQPPLSHLGATLLRHVIGSGLRYALYQLGLPIPTGPPVRIARLRLFLDGRKVGRLLAAAAGGGEVAAALLAPGGAAADRLPNRLAGAAAFHRARLLLTGGRDVAAARAAPGGGHAGFHATLAAVLPALGDAFLAELVASVARRARRRRGRAAGPVMSREAARWRAGRPACPDRLGPPDLYRPSWAEAPGEATTVGGGPAAPAAAHPLRGRFRESYRAALDRLRPPFLGLARRAVEHGLLAGVDDAFFIPLDLAADLELEVPPAWLVGAVAANRAEYESELAAASPPEELTAADPRGPVGLGGGGWEASPLEPLV